MRRTAVRVTLLEQELNIPVRDVWWNMYCKAVWEREDRVMKEEEKLKKSSDRLSLEGQLPFFMTLLICNPHTHWHPSSLPPDTTFIGSWKSGIMSVNIRNNEIHNLMWLHEWGIKEYACVEEILVINVRKAKQRRPGNFIQGNIWIMVDILMSRRCGSSWNHFNFFY